MTSHGSFLGCALIFASLVFAACGGADTTAGDAGPDANTGGDGAGAPDGLVGPACTGDAQCAQPTPYCDTAASVCVQCLGDPNCANNQNNAHTCNLSSHTCVQCATSANCGGQDPYCSPTGACVQCLADGNCGQNQKCNPTTYRCVNACTSDGQCAFPTPYCNTTGGYCVQCLSTANCANNQNGDHVCDTSTDTCVECLADTDCTDPQQPRCYAGDHRCVECLTNADCGTNGVCSANHSCQ